MKGVDRVSRTDPTPVRSVRDGHHLRLAFGGEPKGKSAPIIGLAVLCGVLFFAGMIAAGILEADHQILAFVVGYGGLGCLVAALWFSLVAASRSGAFSKHKRGQVNVTRNSLDTSLEADPYARIRMTSSATDDFPQFRRSIELGLIDRINTAPSQLRHRGAGHEVRVQARSGVEYVIAINRTAQEAQDIANQLRAHLELSADPASTVAELRDAVTEQIKGPIIVPEQERAPYERD